MSAGVPDPVRTCRLCGCTSDAACPGGCSWVAEDLCSRCVEDLLRRVLTVLECPGSMCGHCIEVLTGEVPAAMTLAEFTGPCTRCERTHLYQIGCSSCGKTSSEHGRDS